MEAISHLVGGFARSARDLPLATAAAAATVGVVYLAVAAASLLVLGAAADDPPLRLSTCSPSGWVGRR